MGERTSESQSRELLRDDPQFLEDCLAELAPKVHRWLYRQLGPRSDLEDAVQDALTEIARALPRFEGRAKLSTFAHRIVIRTGYRYMRRCAEPSPEWVEPKRNDVSPETIAANREALRRLHKVLERLPRKRRMAFVLCAIEGLDARAAAEREGISAARMRNRLRHARKEVLRRMQHDPFFRTLMGLPNADETSPDQRGTP